MKTKRFLLAAALTMAAAACSADVTAPDAALRAPAGAYETAAAPDSATTTTATTTDPVAPKNDDGGHTGSGVGQ